MRWSWCAGLVLSVAALCAAGSASADYFRPTAGNQYSAQTAKYLYVIWAVPNSLEPLSKQSSPAAVELLIGRTAIFLCKEHLKVDPDPARPCKLQVVRMSTNDEYTKSAAGGFKTVATLVLAKDKANDATLAAAEKLELAALKALFQRFEVDHERLRTGSAS
jgi:hypothetical protein